MSSESKGGKEEVQEESSSSSAAQVSGEADSTAASAPTTTTPTKQETHCNSELCVGSGGGLGRGGQGHGQYRGGGGRFRRLSESGPPAGPLAPYHFSNNCTYNWKRNYNYGGGWRSGGGGGGWRYRKQRGWAQRKRAMSQPLELTPPDSAANTTPRRTPERDPEDPIPIIRRSISLGNSAKKAKRLRKRLKHKLGHVKRLRFGTQPAPSNNNEFLMQEHDHLHFEENHHHLCNDEDRRSDELNAYYSSSPEDEEEYLVRDFSNTYDGVHTERLNSMSKSELISEYQMLEERVESLEQMVKRTRMSSESMEPGSPPFFCNGGLDLSGSGSGEDIDNEIDTSPVLSTTVPTIIPKIDPETVKATLQELSQLRAENEKLRAENSVLKETKAIPSI